MLLARPSLFNVSIVKDETLMNHCLLSKRITCIEFYEDNMIKLSANYVLVRQYLTFKCADKTALFALSELIGFIMQKIRVVEMNFIAEIFQM